MNPSDSEILSDLAQSIRGCASWHDIHARWRNLPEKRKGDLFEQLVKAYLQLEPEYASKLKHVWLQREVPQAIARKLKLPATDQGIDIIAETHDGEFWAIQCKYRQDTDQSLTWRDISTFTGLAFGVCRGFSFGIISFHGSIQRAELFKTHNDAFSNSFRSYGNLETFHVSGKTATGTRARIIGEFARAERALITNARCLTEGVDVPGIDCVLFADPRRSAVDIVQAVGRALRPAPGKQCGYVIVPILHDADATADDIFQSPAFKEVLTTLRALAANDDRIIEYFRGVSQGQQRKGGGSVQFDIDERLAKRINLADFAREIELKCWDRLAKLSWRPFEEVREFVRGLGFSNQTEWNEFSKGELSNMGTRPPDIPAAPHLTYAEQGWRGYGDWLGTGNIHSKQWRPFEKAREFARGLGLKGQAEWTEFCKGSMPHLGSLPPDIPSNPSINYAGIGWSGYGDWLGTGNVAPQLRKFRPFLEAREFARSLGLKRSQEWSMFCKGAMPEKGHLPSDVPQSPNRIYADKGWIGYGDWLGTSRIANHKRKFASFKEAREFARLLNLRSGQEWKAFCKGEIPEKGTLPQNIPYKPSRTYKDKGWAGIGDWIGTGAIAPRLREFRAFEKARAFVQSLGLKSNTEWKAYCRGQMPQLGILPVDIPSNPNRTYKDIGWSSMGDWIGTGRTRVSKSPKRKS